MPIQNPLIKYKNYLLFQVFVRYRMIAIEEAGGYKYLSKYDTGRLAYNLGNVPQAD